MAEPPDDVTVRDAIRAQVNEGLAEGGLYGAVLAATGSLGVIVALAITDNTLWKLAGAFGVLSLASALGLSFAGRTGRVHGAMRYLLMIPFVSLPTFYFVAAEALYPAGMASVIMGPFSYVYLFLIGLTGFVFDFRVSFVCGVVAALEYLACFALSVPTLVLIEAPDPLLYQDLTHPFVAMNKALIMVAMGAATGGLTLIARRLLRRTLEAQARHVPGANRSDAVVLFAELRGLDGMDPPEETLARLDRHLEKAGEAVQDEGGTVDKIMGSTLLAVFGGPGELAAPASHAVCAALRMQESVHTLNAEGAREGRASLACGIGIHAGSIVVGAAGPRGKKELTAFGGAVGLASRLGAEARRMRASILVSEAVFGALEPTEQGLFEPAGEPVLTEGEPTHALYAVRERSIDQ